MLFPVILDLADQQMNVRVEKKKEIKGIRITQEGTQALRMKQHQRITR